jgi:ketosteroid isomerase-like protein
MADAVSVAEDFFTAWTSKDFGRARSLLHDDLSFRGPIDTFTDADSYIQAIQQLSQIVVAVQRHKLFVDGDDVCVIYDLNTVPVPQSPTAEWYLVRDEKIASIQVFFDARPFAELAAGRQQ